MLRSSRGAAILISNSLNWIIDDARPMAVRGSNSGSCDFMFDLVYRLRSLRVHRLAGCMSSPNYEN